MAEAPGIGLGSGKDRIIFGHGVSPEFHHHNTRNASTDLDSIMGGIPVVSTGLVGGVLLKVTM
jgi:hypothetical protein